MKIDEYIEELGNNGFEVYKDNTNGDVVKLIVWYDESDPCAFDGGCIMELHQLADEALALASGYVLNEGDI